MTLSAMYEAKADIENGEVEGGSVATDQPSKRGKERSDD